jgi:photosystem II stability/assembly factor-like uncharacterized protein
MFHPSNNGFFIFTTICLLAASLSKQIVTGDRLGPDIHPAKRYPVESVSIPDIAVAEDAARTQFGPAELRHPSMTAASMHANTVRSLRASARPPAQENAGTFAEPVSWVTYPLYGGEMTSIAADPTEPQVVYVGTRDAGVFKTTDGGLTWKQARTGLTFYPIRSLQVDPRNSEVVYAGTDFNGLWKFTDGGASWIKTSNGLDESLIVFQIVIDPKSPDTIYVGLAGGIGLGIGNIYRSLDGGATWERKDDGLPKQSDLHTNGIRALAMDRDNPATVYAGTSFDGVFRSTDSGDTWSALNDCLPFRRGSDNYREPVNALALNPHDNYRPSANISWHYYILDDEECWQKVSDDYIGGIFTHYLFFHPFDSLTIYVAGTSFFGSNDGGMSWERRLGHPDSGSIPEIAFHPSFPDTIFAATNVGYYDPGGVYRSTDQGITWAKMSDGITATAVRSVAVDQQDSAYLYVGNRRGHLFRSHDGGLTWDQLYSSPNNPVFGFEVIDIAVGPVSSQHIYVVGNYLFRSTDRGESFDRIAEVRSPSSIAIMPGAPGPIYVGTIQGHGIYKSSDGGETWIPKNNGLPFDGVFGYSHILSLTSDPNEPQTVWAGTWHFDGIFRSIDGGELWISKGLTGNNGIRAIAVKPGNSNEILVGTDDLGKGTIYKSTDGGSTWQIKTSGIGSPFKITYNPQNINWLYATTEGTGVIRSLDGGETWQEYNDGIFYPVVYDLDVSRDDPPLLVAGTYGSGVVFVHDRQPAAEIVVTEAYP